MGNKRIDPTVAEPLIRMAISSLDSAIGRTFALDPVLLGTNVRRQSKLATAQKRIAEADRLLREFAEANAIPLRHTMQT
ncbi:hypothetical protein [Mycobacterium sp. AZCC_0083]|uniref:hypothetical protein n=1 Tax=Mycobacterium sp. AZCC_0083 TaxID=2735882 RepID=UPI001620E23C|nr:hypothetical protein [Mycobacterium sp. AZCC_0083]MBB5167223.1 hypothetical protein [Mycobacterium sp. AZCC_0083]